MCDARLLQAYEVDDENYAHSTRATACAEFLSFVRSVQWMSTAFRNDDAYAELVQDVSAEALKQSLELAMNLRAAIHTKARHIKVRNSESVYSCMSYAIIVNL